MEILRIKVYLTDHIVTEGHADTAVMLPFTGDCDSPLFRGLPETFPVARYHSLAAAPETMPECLQVTAQTEDGEVMAVKHRDYPIYGVQFHPESILTPDGKQMLKNFMELKG